MSALLPAARCLAPGPKTIAQEEAQLADFQPHFKAVVQHLPQLQQVLQLQPAPKVHQSSSSTPQPTVGSHRVWACGILHMLLLHNNTVIDRAVADAGLLPSVLALAFRHGHCSAVQCRAVEMLRSSLRSNVQELWQGLFSAGYGRELRQSGGSGEELLLPLHEGLVQIGEVLGKRGREWVGVRDAGSREWLQHCRGCACAKVAGKKAVEASSWVWNVELSSLAFCFCSCNWL